MNIKSRNKFFSAIVALAILLNLCIVLPDNPFRASATQAKIQNGRSLIGDTLLRGQRMYSNEFLMSSNKQFIAVLQDNGDLAVCNTSGVLWQTNTAIGSLHCYLAVQVADGNLVLYNRPGPNSQTALWSNYTLNIDKLVMENNGSLVAYSTAGSILWQTGAKSPALYYYPELTPPIDDGTYWIINAQSGLALTAGPNQWVTQSANNNATTQRWIVTYHRDGYTIRPESSPTEYLRNSVIYNLVANDPGDGSIRWGIRKYLTHDPATNTASGNYVIRTRQSYTNNVLATDYSFYGNSVVNLEHTPNYNATGNFSDDCGDEWIFVPVRPVVTKLTAGIYRDNLYHARYSNYPSEVNQTFADATKPFYKKYGLEYTISYNSTKTSMADGCPIIYGWCRSMVGYCGTTCVNRKAAPNHHRNVGYNVQNMFSSGKGSVYIAFGLTDSDLCYTENGVHDTTPGVWDLNISTGMISQGGSHVFNVRVMQHEISHEYGAQDHAYNGQKCIMSGDFTDVYEYNLETVWCVSCWMQMIQVV